MVTFVLLLGILIMGGATTLISQTSPPQEIALRIERFSPEMRAEIGAVQYVLTSTELDELLSSADDYECRRWIDNYWNLRDPIFTTPENENRVEHDRRAALARSEFFIPRWPMCDQRGEVYIRYGAPDARRIIKPEVGPGGTTPPGELWYYRRHEMLVLFEDAVGRGEYTYYLERVKGPRGNRMRGIERSLDAPTGETIDIPSVAITSGGGQYQKRINKFYAVRQATPSSYPFNFQQHQLPFVFSVDNFRGGEWVNRVDVNVEFVADLSWIPGRATSEYVTTAVFWDTNRKEIARREQRLQLPIAEGAVDSVRMMPSQIVFSLPPGFYYMAVTVEEPKSSKASSYRTDVTCQDFESKLAISDIVFASRVRTTTRTSPFSRGALEVVPHPARRYRKPQPIPIYFEVYNLGLDNRGLSSYNVEYRIISRTPRQLSFWDSLRGKKSSLDVSSTFHSSNQGSQDTVHITLGSENMWEGEFALHVKITDDVTRAEVSREVAFNILE